MTSKISYRLATASEADSLNEVRIKAIQSVKDSNPDYVALDQAFDWIQKDSVDRLSHFISDPERIVTVACDGSETVLGYSVVRFNEVERLFVSPTAQGLGVGKQLLAYAEEHIYEFASSRNLPCIVKVDSFVTSRSFYEAVGYIATGSRRFVLDQSTIHTYWMVKDLSNPSNLPSHSNMSMELARGEIDAIDRDIILLLMKRFAVTEWVGEHKALQNLPSYDEGREMAQRLRLEELSDLTTLPNPLIQYIFSMVRDDSKLNHFYVRESSHFD